MRRRARADGLPGRRASAGSSVSIRKPVWHVAPYALPPRRILAARHAAGVTFRGRRAPRARCVTTPDEFSQMSSGGSTGRSTIIECSKRLAGLRRPGESMSQASPFTPKGPAPVADLGARAALVPARLSARLEPFDSYWQAPEDVDRGYQSFKAYYRANYLKHIPADREARILVVSCGPGYLVDLLVESGYRHALGIDSDAAKVAHALKRSLPCETAQVFPHLAAHQNAEYDCII